MFGKQGRDSCVTTKHWVHGQKCAYVFIKMIDIDTETDLRVTEKDRPPAPEIILAVLSLFILVILFCS